MSVPLTINGVTYQYPVTGDTNWGPVLTAWSTAVTNALSIISGGNASFLTITSQNANPATSGYLRLSNTDTISWRNFANSANLPLAVNSSNQLTFNGTPIGASASLTDGHIFVGNVSNQPADVAMSGDITISNTGVTAIGSGVIVNADINASAAIARSKIAAGALNTYVYNSAVTGLLTDASPLAASRAMATDSTGLPDVTAVTSTELGRLSGVTSAIQTQLDAKLNLSGGTMAGVLNMGSNKITSVPNGTVSSDAVNLGQIYYGFQAPVQQTTTTATSTTSTTYVATTSIATIVPTSAAHRIKITVSGCLTTVGLNEIGKITVDRNGTPLSAANGFTQTLNPDTNPASYPVSIVYIDSPATTSSIAYTLAIKSTNGGTIIWTSNTTTSVITLEEIV